MRLLGFIAVLFLAAPAFAEDQPARDLDRQLAVDALMRADKHAGAEDYAAAEVAFLYARVIDSGDAERQ